MKRGSRLAIAAVVVLGTVSACNVYDADLLKVASSGTLSAGSRACGNGVLDEGEACDVKIESGSDGACPSACETTDACQPQLLVGTGCQRQCLGVVTTNAWNNDGCCPPGVSAAEDSDCGFCGDGIVGPAEACDPPETCPTRAECTQNSSGAGSCFFGMPSGDPKTCDARCRMGLATNCIAGDNCCPASCSSENDSDCSASCGDGFVQAAETCEPTSASMPCPESCDDGIACTTDLMAGSAENCNVECANVAILQPTNGDGCCPVDANAVNDSDCLPACGNHVREGAETCDPCPESCDDGDACSDDSMSGSSSSCSVVCTHSPRTEVDGDACCPAGANQTTDSDCPPVCGNGVVESGEECDNSAPCNADCSWRSGLLHRYDFSGTGTDVVDSAGTADGSVVGGASLTGSGELSLAGGSSGQYVSLPAGLISGLTNATVEVWFTWQGGNLYQRVFDFGNGSAGEATSFWTLVANCFGGNPCVNMNFTSTRGDSSQDHALDAPDPLQIGTRRHMAVVFDDANNRYRLYFDGARVATESNVTGNLSAIDDHNVWIGRSNFNDDEFKGVIDELRIYSTVLDDAALADSFQRGP